nr:MarR family transcriptional regulator [Kineococcus vitellinus]
MPVARFQVLRSIARRDEGGRPCRVQDLAGDLEVTVGGISKLVDRLEAARLCERRSNPEDRRSSLLRPTAAGRELLAAAERTAEAELSRHLGTLPTTDLRRFAAVLEELNR